MSLQECQNLLEENRRLLKLNGIVTNGSVPHHHDDMSLANSGNTVEEVVLQTQIDTLQWQLNQVRLRNCKKKN